MAACWVGCIGLFLNKMLKIRFLQNLRDYSACVGALIVLGVGGIIRLTKIAA